MNRYRGITILRTNHPAAVLLRLFLLFTIVPLAELSILFWVAEKTNWLVALAMVVLPAILGSWLIRHQGLHCWRRVHEQVSRGQLPADSLLDGLLILIAGPLLITPGLLTDTVGFLLLIPPFRRLIRRYVVRRIKLRILSRFTDAGGEDGGDSQRILDARVVDDNRHDSNTE